MHLMFVFWTMMVRTHQLQRDDGDGKRIAILPFLPLSSFWSLSNFLLSTWMDDGPMVLAGFQSTRHHTVPL